MLPKDSVLHKVTSGMKLLCVWLRFSAAAGSTFIPLKSYPLPLLFNMCICLLRDEVFRGNFAIESEQFVHVNHTSRGRKQSHSTCHDDTVDKLIFAAYVRRLIDQRD